MNQQGGGAQCSVVMKNISEFNIENKNCVNFKLESANYYIFYATKEKWSLVTKQQQVLRRGELT